MGLFRKKPAVEPEERRIVRRHRVDCPASFVGRGAYHGRLADLSEEGARFEGAPVPTMGSAGTLTIAGLEEVGAKVQWIGEGACGLVFERPVPAPLVEQLAAERLAQAGPAADLGNIPTGQKRAHRLVRSDTAAF